MNNKDILMLCGNNYKIIKEETIRDIYRRTTTKTTESYCKKVIN